MPYICRRTFVIIVVQGSLKDKLEFMVFPRSEVKQTFFKRNSVSEPIATEQASLSVVSGIYTVWR
jgi:hypothetical protein